jgi:glycosyltransferase involved in cell wall biosynthesis
MFSLHDDAAIVFHVLNNYEVQLNDRASTHNRDVTILSKHDTKEHPLYSICATNYNTEDSVKQALESIITQIDERFEIIVVDNCSEDASLDILREYSDKRIKLIVRKCSRGLGRQIAIENSTGKYIITSIDMDDVLKPNLSKLLQIYHEFFEGYMLLTDDAITMAPRVLIDAIGGFRDLNYHEERELWIRAAQLGYLRILKPSFRLREREIKKKKTSARFKRMIEQQYMKYREYFRIGEGPRSCYHAFITSTNIRKSPLVFLARLLVVPWAFVTYRFYPQFRNEFVRYFNLPDYEVKIDSVQAK